MCGQNARAGAIRWSVVAINDAAGSTSCDDSAKGVHKCIESEIAYDLDVDGSCDCAREQCDVHVQRAFVTDLRHFAFFSARLRHRKFSVVFYFERTCEVDSD